MRVRRAFGVLVIVLALVGAKCGGQGGKDGAAGRIEVVAVWGGGDQANFSRVLERFNAANRADARYTAMSGDTFGDVIRDRVEAGRPPDVAVLPQPGLLRDLARTKSLIPLEPIAGSLVDRNYAPYWRELGSLRGTLYGVWFKAAHKSVIWYRPNALDAGRVAPPRTWAELVTTAQTLGRGGGTPLALGAGDGWPLTDWFENVYLRTAGQTKYDQLACHEIRWTDPTVLHALTTLGQVLGRPEWLAGGVTGSLATTFTKSVEQVFGDQPPAAMVAGGDFVAALVPRGKSVGVDARAFDFPSIDGSKPAVVVGGDAVVLLRDTKVGRDLVRFLATPEAAEAWARAGGFISPNRALARSVYPDDTALSLARGIRETELIRYDLSDLQPASFGAIAGQGMWRILQDYLRNPSDVNGIASRLDEAASVANVRC